MRHEEIDEAIKTVIGPHPPYDGQQWDCQCARCGSSLTFEDCEGCGGDGLYGHDCGEDSCCCLNPEDNVPCDICRGEGAFPVCMSSPYWCDANPLPGREKVAGRTPEWFRVCE